MTKKILVLIFIIYLALLLVGCSSIPNTTINNIHKYPDRYVDKKVIIIAVRDYYKGTTYGDLKGFGINDDTYFGGIYVSFIDDAPSRIIKDEWERDKYVKVKVTGIVRHKIMNIGLGNKGIFYIEGESWEYVD